MNSDSNYLYLIDPDTGEIIAHIDRYYWDLYQWKHNIDIEPNQSFNDPKK